MYEGNLTPMYDLPYFKERDENVIMDFIHKNPFAFISGCDENNLPVATQVPVFIEEENGQQRLRGHIMRNSEHHLAFLHNPNVLVVFTGNHTYVSATWYSNPHQASTWNYMSVHAKGKIHFVNEEGLVKILRKTTLHFEGYNRDSNTVFENLPAEYTHRLMKGIVGFEIIISELRNVFKLSQNRDEESFGNIINHLGNADDPPAKAISEEMKKRKKDLYG